MQWFAQAPSNIALIKYMGKKEGETNIPINPSISYTLNTLLSSVVLEEHPGKQDLWEPLHIPGAQEFKLSQSSQTRFLNHLATLKKYFNHSGGFVVRSSNNFPHGNGLASSASSFAALTKCGCLALSELTNRPLPDTVEQAMLSRQGSGSSCRSFFSPWAVWQDEDVKAIEIPYNDLIHQVIIISHEEKEVPSTEAHERIRTSKLYASRERRATDNFKRLLEALNEMDWASAYEICWHEFHDIHQLFRTCDKPFSYMTDESEKALSLIQDLWERAGDGPIVTMDAGPNIHLLYRRNQIEMAQQFKKDYLVGNYDLI